MALDKNKTGIMAAISAATEGKAPIAKPTETARAHRTLPKGTVGSVRAGLGGIQEIETALILPWGPSDRLELTAVNSGDDDVHDLIESIQHSGQQVPVLLRPAVHRDGKFEVVYGRRRILACQQLGIPVKALIRTLDDGEALIAKGLENAGRQDLSFYERARFARAILDQGHSREEAQKLNNHFGKIVRLNEDGSVPADNPFVGQEGALPEIWSYGHRNPQGIILSSDGRVLENEHGPAGGDEINHIKPGANYGWPTVTYALDYSGGRISPFEALEGTEQSLVHFTPSIAPSGFAQYSGEAFPDWQGDLFASALALKHVRHIEMNSDGSLGKQQELFGELDMRFRDVRNGPDGFLYLLTEEPDAQSRILRIRPKSGPAE